jgi:hypothetical protein
MYRLHCTGLSTQFLQALQVLWYVVLSCPLAKRLRLRHNYCHGLLLHAVAMHKHLQDKGTPATQSSRT